MDWSLLGFKGLGEVLNIHPVFVHFPIALYPTALLFYGLGILKKHNGLALAGQICLGLGLAGALLSVVTGYWAQESIPHGEAIHRIMEVHELLGFTILGLGAFLTVWSFLKREGMPKASKGFMVLLILANFIILQNADLGGRMVFVEGAAVKALQVEPSRETSPDLEEAKPDKEHTTHEHHDHGHDHHH